MSSKGGNRKTTVSLPAAPPTSTTTTHPRIQKSGAPSSAGSTTRGATAADLQQLRQKIADLISKKPDQAAKILAHWIFGAAPQQKKQKKAV